MTHGNFCNEPNAMGRFGEVNFTDIPAVFQPHEHVEARVLKGRLLLEIDCYSKTGAAEAAGDEWDVDQWEREQIVLDAIPSRETWYEAWRAARALLGGRTVTCLDGNSISIESHLREARL